MPHPVIHAEIRSDDPDATRRFFADLFGWKIDADNPLKYGSVEDAGIAGGIASGPTPDYDGHVTFYVGVPDVEAALSKAEALGGTRVFGPAPVQRTEIELGQFTDLEGHLIGLMKSAG